MNYTTTLSEKIKNKITNLIYPFNDIDLNYSLDESEKYKKLSSELYDAIVQQNISLIYQKLKAGANINYTPENKIPALQVLLSVCKDNPKTEKTIQFLLEHGANPNLKDSYGRTALHQSIDLFLPHIAQKLIKYKADVNATDNLGQTPLHFCAMTGHSQLTQLLIQKGADINKQDSENKTPLYTAVEYYANKVIQVLLKNNADCFIPNKHGVAPYIYAESIKNSYGPIAYQDFNIYAQKQLKNMINTATTNELLNLPEKNPSIIQGLIHYRLLHNAFNQLSETNQQLFYNKLRQHYTTNNSNVIVRHKPCQHCKIKQKQR